MPETSLNSEASLKKRRRLSLLVRSMLVVMVLSFAFIFFRGISSTSIDGANGGDESSVMASLLLGQTALRRVAGQRIWITRLSDAQRTQAIEINPHVFSIEDGCAVDLALCSLSAATEQSGVELSFTEQAPAQLPSQIPWYGGFVNPINGAVYDRLGRAYRLGELAPVVLEVIDLSE